jgi:hypothetical protein
MVIVSAFSFTYSMKEAKSVGSKVLARDDGHRHLGHQADVFEGVQRVIGQVAIQRGAGRHADVVQQDGVAVGLGRFATLPAPSVPPAPPTFSTMICWPRSADIFSAIRRPTVSVGPPAEKGTTMVICRSG